MRQSRIAVFAGVVLLLGTVPARGTIQRTFVSRNGLDTNTCAIDQPCRSFAAAILQTNANGEIVVNDSAGYGPVTITKAVAIVSPLGVHAGISVFSGDGVTINAGATDVVVLRNLYINSQGGVNGITLSAAKAMHIEHCVVSGFSNNDINLVPTTAVNVAITDTVVRQAVGSGIYADSAMSLTVSIAHCLMESNAYGVLADRAMVSISNSIADSNATIGFFARGTGGAASMAIEASAASGSLAFGSSGVRAESGSYATVHNTTVINCFIGYHGRGKLSVDHCVAAGGAYGIDIVGGDGSIAESTLADNTVGVIVFGGTARLTRNTITRNGTGINNASGTVNSAGDNMVDGNTTNASGTITAANKM